jgi:RNA polymerase sigma-70 factor (ECF subfamily)
MDSVIAHGGSRDGQDHGGVTAMVDGVLLAVFEEQQPGLTGFFVRRGGAGAVVEDLLQETLLRAWRHRGSLAPESTAAEGEVREGARRYLWRVARNLMIDEIRCRSRRRVGEGLAPGERGALVAAEPEDGVEHEECLRIIRETVGHLADDRVRTCLELWLAGCDVPGIAGRLGLGAGQVRGVLQRGRSQIIRRARERLRALHAELDGRNRRSP